LVDAVLFEIEDTVKDGQTFGCEGSVVVFAEFEHLFVDVVGDNGFYLFGFVLDVGVELFEVSICVLLLGGDEFIDHGNGFVLVTVDVFLVLELVEYFVADLQRDAHILINN
jgi:hypothetical protein